MSETAPFIDASRRVSVPGLGFKAKINDRWLDYTPATSSLLKQAYVAGFPSMRMNVKGNMYKFDFNKMEQKNLSTLEVHEMRKPCLLERPVRPRSSTCTSALARFRSQRPVYVVRVPVGSPGTTIKIPHPKKLGKGMEVRVPSEAKVGQPLFVPVPRTGVKSKFKFATGGAGGGGAIVAGAFIGNHIAAGGTAATGAAGAAGAAAALGPVAPILIGGAAAAAVVGASAAAVHYTTRNPRKAAAIGVLTIGGLVLVDRFAEDGVTETVCGLAEGVSDIGEDAGDILEGVGDALDSVVDVSEDVGDWMGDEAEHAADVVMDLF